MRILRKNNINTIFIEKGDNKLNFSDCVTSTSTTTLTIPSTDDEFTFINTSGGDWTLNTIAELKINNTNSNVTIANNQSISLKFDYFTKSFIISGRSETSGGGGSGANLTTTQTSTSFTINSDTGTDAVVPLGDGTNAGATLNNFTNAEKSKLSSIASNATVNATDAQLRDRSTHTGTQTASTISDFNSVIDARITNKQDILVSGTNIKTINNTSILGSGNINIAGGGGVTQEQLDLKQNIALASNTPTPSATLDWTPDIINLVLTANTTVTSITNAPVSGGILMIKVTGNFTFKFNLSSYIEEGRQIQGASNYVSILYHPSGQFVITWFNSFITNSKNYIFEDFEAVSSTSIGKLIINNGGGYISDGTSNNTDIKGVVELHTNAAATNKPYIGTSSRCYMLFNHKYDSTWYIKTPSTLSTTTETYQILCGYLSSNSSINQQFSAYFKYDFDGASGKADTDDNLTPSITWKMVNSKDTLIANKTYTDSTVNVVANTWYKLRIIFTSTQVLFYINDILRLTYTGANIPTGGFNYFGNGLTIQKTVGTGDRVLQADYFEQYIDTNNGL